MSKQSFQVGKSLALNPIDLATLTSPVVGELACDINDSNKIKEYNGSVWVEVTTASNTQVVTNKALSDSTTTIVDVSDNTKKIAFDAGGTTGTKTTITGAQTADRVLTLPNNTGTLISTGDTGTVTSSMIADNTIVDVDINSAAAITRSKLASGTNNALQANSGSGVLSDVTDITVNTNDITLANTKHINVNEATDSTTTGSNASLNAIIAGSYRLTNASLVSLANIPAGANGQLLSITNRVGTSVSVVDDSSAVGTAANRIYTGTGASINLANNASLNFKYDNSSSRWQVVGGSGSGSGNGGSVPNYILSPSADTGATGWTTYADAAAASPVNGTGGAPNVTFATTATTPLRGSASFLITKDAANRQGEGVSYDFTIDSADQGKVLQGSFEYQIASGTYADNDLSVWIYDITNARLIQPAPYLIKNSGIIEKFPLEFQTSIDSTSYRLIIHCASTSALAYTVKLDNFNVGPQAKLYGSAVTDWIAYTPTFTGFGTVSTQASFYRRDGDSIEIRSVFVAGTPTAVEARISLPSGLSVISTTATLEACGIAVRNSVSATSFYALLESSVSYMTMGLQNSGAAGLSKANGNSLVSTGDRFSIQAKVPIQGWSSSQVMSSDADTRVVDFTGYVASNTALTTDVTNIPLTVEKDSHGAFVTDTYTIPVAGDYKIDALAITSSGGGSGIAAYVYLNGVKYKYLVNLNTSNYYGGSIIVPNCKAGDTIRFRSSGTATILGTTLASGASNFSITRLTGPAQIAASESVSALYTGAPPTGTLNGSFNLTTFGTKVKDSHNAYSAGTYTVPMSGVYDVSAQISVGATFVAGNNIEIAMFIDGVEKYTGAIYAGGAQGTASPQINVKSVPLLAGQLVSIRSISAGAAPAFNAAATKNFFSITRTGNY